MKGRYPELRKRLRNHQIDFYLEKVPRQKILYLYHSNWLHIFINFLQKDGKHEYYENIFNKFCIQLKKQTRYGYLFLFELFDILIPPLAYQKKVYRGQNYKIPVYCIKEKRTLLGLKMFSSLLLASKKLFFLDKLLETSQILSFNFYQLQEIKYQEYTALIFSTRKFAHYRWR